MTTGLVSRSTDRQGQVRGGDTFPAEESSGSGLRGTSSSTSSTSDKAFGRTVKDSVSLALKEASPKRILRNVLFGQGVSLLMSFTGVFTTLLVNRNTSSPLLQAVCVYIAIALCTLPVLVRTWLKYGLAKACPHALWKYALIALFDLEANYTVVLAYRYTDLTSVQLLDCFTIPCVMVFSRFLIRPKPTYNRWQLLGALVSILGMILLVVIDVLGESRSKDGDDNRESKNIGLGDAFCLIASLLYAASNVLCEKLLKSEGASVAAVESISSTSAGQTVIGYPAGSGGESEVPQPAAVVGMQGQGANTTSDVDGEVSGGTNLPASSGLATSPNSTNGALSFVDTAVSTLCYLALMTSFASVFSLIQFGAVEGSSFSKDIASHWGWQDTLDQLGYTATMVVIYIAMPLLFVYTSATFANISLLSSDVYALLWNAVVFAVRPKPLYFLPFILTISGVILFDLFKGRK
jgi:solute carrier family 35 protein F1/2